MPIKSYSLGILLFFSTLANAQNTENLEDEYLAPLNDHSKEGQKNFVIDLLSLAGYTLDDIWVYQTLPNKARVFQVKYNENSQGGFMFVRWDKNKKENYIANKMIDAGVYYNLNAAQEIMRKQTDKNSFGVEEAALQAPDQERISTEDLEGLRGVYEEQQEEKKLKELERQSKKKKKKRN